MSALLTRVNTRGFVRLTTVAMLPLLASLLAATPAPAATPAGAPGGCDSVELTTCLLPFPDDRFTVPAETPTGVRVNLPHEAMPANAAGTKIDPAEWNRNDGFSPGSMILANVPGLDLQKTFDLAAGQVLDRPSLSLSPAAPIVLLDLETGARVPYFAELDAHPGAVSSDRQLLIVRPLETLRSGHRHAVALRRLLDGAGAAIEPGAVFTWYRSQWGRPPAGVEPRRIAGFQRLFGELRGAGVATDDLYLAWSFTVGSDQGLAGRALHIRDQAFASIGDTDLGDGAVHGEAPRFTVTNVETFPAGRTARRVNGTILVPNYLHSSGLPATGPDGGASLAPLLAGPDARLAYAGTDPGPGSMPIRNAVAPWLSVPYVCDIPSVATASAPASPLLFGHGLLGSRAQVGGRSTELLRARNFAPCGVDFAGMSSMDQGNVLLTLQDLSRFGGLVDRLHQGLLNSLFLGRVLVHPSGFAAHPAFREEGGSLLDTGGLSYAGVSQGAILGGALVALAPDFVNGVLDVTGINYSTLLNRSVNWEGSAVGNLYYASYPDPVHRQIGFALLQMLWDRAEGNGYARHMTSDPLPNTRPHNVLLHAAFGDFQVANVAAEVQARSVGARLLHTSLAPGRHWSDEPGFGLLPFDVAADGSLVPHAGSALVYFDSGNDTPPSVNLVPGPIGGDPHGDPRSDVAANDQRAGFLRSGVVTDVHHGNPYWTQVCRGIVNPNCT